MSLYRIMRVAQIISRHVGRKAKAERREREDRPAPRHQARSSTVYADIWLARQQIVDGLLGAGWNRQDAIQAAARLTRDYKSEAERIHDAAAERVHGTAIAQ